MARLKNRTEIRDETTVSVALEQCIQCNFLILVLFASCFHVSEHLTEDVNVFPFSYLAILKHRLFGHG